MHILIQGDQITYNQWLSDRRAQSTLNYLVSKGISENRLKAFGHGESQLTNDCEDGVKCAEEQHQLNRRSEATSHQNKHECC